MKTVAIEALRKNLKQYVRAAERGETLRVVVADQVVAELGPPSVDRIAEANSLRHAAGRPPLTSVEEDGVREGWLAPATEFGPLPRASRQPDARLDQLMEEIAKDREDR